MFRRLIAMVIMAGVLYFLFLSTLIYYQGTRDEAQRADAIVVLGAAQWHGVPSPVLRARLDHAIALYQQGYAPVLIMTGGKQEGDRFTEAETGREYAIKRGVPPTSIRMETTGRTTLESLRSTQAIMAAMGLRRAILVSDPFHMYRAKRMARDLGIEALASPTRSSPISRGHASELRHTLREAAVFTHYLVRGS